MMQDGLYEKDEIDTIKKQCAEDIAEFGKQFQIIRELYEDFGFYYPEECITNYRDSWFHYRKLYVKKEILAVYNEKYGLEEHLLRAVRDAQIFLLQQLAFGLDIWYRHEKYVVCDMTQKDKYEKVLENFEENWVANLWQKTKDDTVLFANACIYQYISQIETDDVRTVLQKLIHSTKNLILDLRLNGVNIYRPIDNMYYVEQCIKIYNEICTKLKEAGVIYLVSPAVLIANTCKANISYE